MGSTFKCARIAETRLRKAIPDELELWPGVAPNLPSLPKLTVLTLRIFMKNRVFQDYVDLVISGTSGVNARKCRLVCVVLSDSPRHRRADPWARFASWPHGPPLLLLIADSPENREGTSHTISAPSGLTWYILIWPRPARDPTSGETQRSKIKISPPCFKNWRNKGGSRFCLPLRTNTSAKIESGAEFQPSK